MLAESATIATEIQVDDLPMADPSLQLDVALVLAECHRERRAEGVFRDGLSRQHLDAFAALVARRLAPRIGGRYIPRRVERDRIAERDEQVARALAAGSTPRQVMRDFAISRRLLYAILARRKRAGV